MAGSVSPVSVAADHPDSSSSLDAVGFLAAITSRLAEAGISVNAVWGYQHDHLFVPDQKATEVLNLLQAMGASTHD